MIFVPDNERCPGNGDEQCNDCLWRQHGNPYSSYTPPPPRGTECDRRMVTLEVAILETQGRGD